MKTTDSRRDFFKKFGGLALAGGAISTLSNCAKGDSAQEYSEQEASVQETSAKGDSAGLPKNIIYTQKEQGNWQGKADGHVPVVTKNEDGSLNIETKHEMTEAHHIVSHRIVNPEGKNLFHKVFKFSDEAKSTVPADVVKGENKIFVLSFCNQHDLWLNEVSFG